jgi:hypothetical protein
LNNLLGQPGVTGLPDMKDNIGPQVASNLRGFEAAAAQQSVFKSLPRT